MVHFLKCSTKYFYAVKNGVKKFEVRKNDRNFNVEDVLVLEEYIDGKYTGAKCERYVNYILNDPEYCKEGYVILGF